MISKKYPIPTPLLGSDPSLDEPRHIRTSLPIRKHKTVSHEETHHTELSLPAHIGTYRAARNPKTDTCIVSVHRHQKIFLHE